MGYIQNPLGAGGFNPQPLGNLTAGLEALQETEIAARLREIEKNKQWQHDKDLENEKWALQMAMPQQYDAVRAKSARDFAVAQKELTDFEANEIKKVGSPGKLSLEQKIAIQEKWGALANKIKDENNFANALNEYQKWLVRVEPTLESDEARKQFYAQQAEVYKAINDPNQENDTSLLINAMKTPEPSTKTLFLLDKPIFDDIIKNATIPGQRGTVVADKPTALQKIIDFIPHNPKNTYQKGLQEGLWANENEYAEAAYNLSEGNMKTNAKEYKPTSGYERGGVNIAKLPELTPVDVTENGETAQFYNFPQQLSRVERTFSVGDALDPTTGKVISINKEVPLKIVSVSKDKGIIRAEIYGKEVEKNGKPVFVYNNMSGYSLKDKMKSSDTEEDVIKNALPTLATQTDKPKEWSTVTDAKVIPNKDGSYTLKGTLQSYPNWKYLTRSPGYKPKEGEKPIKTEEVSMTIYPVIDESQSKTIDLPIEEYKGMLGVLDKYKVGEQTLGDFLETESPAKTEDKQTKKVDDPLGIL